ncbi:MAG: hypothetical protein GF353_04540 [Candidatus Lokiarchaeota archaeon]|nr:hypothetical protein [Candidatus Lokiarchaeota archaeon]
MKRSKKRRIDKDDLDYELISLSKERDDYSKILFYDKAKSEAVLKLRKSIDEKITRLMNIYHLV